MMRTDLDASKAVCWVCGQAQTLDTDARRATEELAAFTSSHSDHDGFAIDIVTGRVPRYLRSVPTQRHRPRPED